MKRDTCWKERVSAGKALRPALCLFSCEAHSGSWEQAMPAAVALELVHNFSLVHDDIQDGDTERRHRSNPLGLVGAATGHNSWKCHALAGGHIRFIDSPTA